MEYQLTCADFTFPLLPHDQILQLIAMLEFNGVDIGLFEERSHSWPSSEFDNLSMSAQKLKQKLNDQGLKAADIFLKITNDFDEYATNHPQVSRQNRVPEWFLHPLEYAAECGCEHVTTLPGVRFNSEYFETSFARATEELAWRVERAGEHDIDFGFEAHVGSIVPDRESAEQLLE